MTSARVKEGLPRDDAFLSDRAERVKASGLSSPGPGYGASMKTCRATSTEPTFSASLREQCDRIWAGLHAHPFLGELTRGTLPLDRFRFFIEQDLLFLPAFARCVAMGAAKSQSEEELEFFTRQMEGIICMEIPSNRSLLAHVVGYAPPDLLISLANTP